MDFMKGEYLNQRLSTVMPYLKSFRWMIGIYLLIISCTPKPPVSELENPDNVVKPLVITEQVLHDSDDPAIWIDPSDSTHVLILGTDKGDDIGYGGLFVFDLSGAIIDSITSLQRPNNVDVAYGLTLNGKKVDIAVFTERDAKRIRVFSLPDMKAIDGGGIQVFENEPDIFRYPMGIALYTNPTDQKIYAIVGRKSGPVDGTYLWQYALEDNGAGLVVGELKRKFGLYSNKKEIESIAVDNELGYVYYSDEKYGIHKAYAHPDSSRRELALFGLEGFSSDIEGISIFKNDDGTGLILVSDQQANRFWTFPREGIKDNPHQHPGIGVIYTSAVECDGIELASEALPGFPSGLLVAMSDDRTFHFYDWGELRKHLVKE